MSEHTPAPTPSRAAYGFILAFTSKLVFTIYLIWALIPESWFRAIGFTYFVSRYWAVVIPMFFLTLLALFAFIIYPSMGLIMTPDWSDLRTIKDEHSENNRNNLFTKDSRVKNNHSVKNDCCCSSVNDCKKIVFEKHDANEYEHKKIPKLEDLNIIDVSKQLYLKSY